jgi:small-conductance mechanosensitive channel
MVDDIRAQLAASASAFIAYLPDLLAGLTLLVAGWLLARILRLVTERSARGLNRLLDRLLPGATLGLVRIPATAARLLGLAVFWITILLFATAAIRILGLTGMALWLERIVTYLPSAAAGVVVILAGLILGNILRNLVTHAAASANLVRAPLLGQATQVATVTVALVIGLDQVGIDVTFLILVLAIVLAAAVTGFALAFGLGSQNLVRNLIATHHLKLFIRAGQQARIGEVEGRVLEFTATGVVLETAEGTALVPGARCLDESVTVLNPETADGQP